MAEVNNTDAEVIDVNDEALLVDDGLTNPGRKPLNCGCTESMVDGDFIVTNQCRTCFEIERLSAQTDILIHEVTGLMREVAYLNGLKKEVLSLRQDLNETTSTLARLVHSIQSSTKE